MSQHTDLKGTVISLLRDSAEAKLSELRPDYIVGFDVSRSSRATLGWERRYDAAVAEREAHVATEYEALCAEHEVALRRVMAHELNELRQSGMRRLRRALRSRYLPADLKAWATRQFTLALKKRNPWAVAYLVLVLRDVVEWESAHDADDSDALRAFEASALEQAQAEWVRTHTLEQDAYDGSPSLKALAGRDEPVESTL